MPPFMGHHELIKKVSIDFYTGRFVEFNNRSTEHIVPKSKGGISNIKNYVMTDRIVNSDRGNMDLIDWFNIHPNFIQNAKNYITLNLNLKIDGVNHGKEVLKTLIEKYGLDLFKL